MIKHLYQYPILLLLISSITSCTNNQNNPDSGNKGKSNSINTSLFERISPEKSNIHFSNILKESAELNIINYHYFYNGGGVACGYINNDGLLDIYICKSGNLIIDANQDGFNDIFMGGNLYNAEVETPRNDAGYGNLLLNDKNNSFKYIAQKETSYFAESNVKKIKLIRLANNQSAILVGQNSGPLRLFGLVP